jgi:lysozyme
MAMPYLHAKDTKLLLQVKSDLDRHEGFREFAYPDPLSPLHKKAPAHVWGTKPAREIVADFKEEDGAPWTFGFGFTKGVTSESRIDRIRAERKLEEHTLEMDGMLTLALPWYKEASFVTKTVLINMGFNLGLAGLLKFKNTLAYVKAKTYVQAAANMRKSLWYKQVGKRADELAKRMETQTIEPQHKAKETVQ